MWAAQPLAGASLSQKFTELVLLWGEGCWIKLLRTGVQIVSGSYPDTAEQK